jgi:hypothetical protein
MKRGMITGVINMSRGLAVKPHLCGRSSPLGTAETRRAQRRLQGGEGTNWPSFSDEYSGGWSGSVSADFVPLRFNGAGFNGRVTAKRSHAAAWLPALLLLCFWAALGVPLSGAAATGPVARDYTLFLLSDVHVGAKSGQGEQPTLAAEMVVGARSHLEMMRGLVGQKYPARPEFAALNLGAVARPRGLFILGDLTDGHKELAVRQEQWRSFDTLFPALGVAFEERTVPVFACAGNHDGALDGPARLGLVHRNRELAQAKNLAAISTNGVHFALNWNGVHFISLNLCPADTTDAETLFKYGKPGQGSWNDPQGALTFLREYLARHVGASGAPVVLMHHYGFDGFSLNDWNWWTPKQRRALYELLGGYNVAAIFHGHDHHAEHYQWPDPDRHASDLKFFFDGKVPANPRRYDILACGNVCWVIRIHNDQFIAAHFKGYDWSKDPTDFFVKSLKP